MRKRSHGVVEKKTRAPASYRGAWNVENRVNLFYGYFFEKTFARSPGPTGAGLKDKNGAGGSRYPHFTHGF